MPFQKLSVTLSAEGDAVASSVLTERSNLETIMDVVASPFGVTADDSEFVQKKVAAYGSLAWGAAGFMVGEAYGNKRGRTGSKSLLPLFRN